MDAILVLDRWTLYRLINVRKSTEAYVTIYLFYINDGWTFNDDIIHNTENAYMCSLICLEY